MAKKSATNKSKKPLSESQIEQRRKAGRGGKGKKKKGYTMSDSAIEQRKEAAKHSTGPITEQGKAASSRNAWKHGQYSRGRDFIEQNWSVGAFGKPCRTTCQYHPDNPANKSLENRVNICSLVLEGITKEGQDCLDKTIYVTAFDDLLKCMQEGKADQMHEVLAAEAAGALELLYRLREEIAENGFVIKMPALNKEQQPIKDEKGNVVYIKYIRNPVLPDYYKLLGELGINLPELLATPKAAEKLTDREDGEKSLAALLGTALGNVAKSRGRVIDHEA